MSAFLNARAETVAELSDKLGIDPEPVLLEVQADLDSNLRFSRRRLVVTGRRLLILPEDGIGQVEISVAELRSAKVERLVGGGRLLLRSEDRQLGVLHFTNAVLPEFTTAVLTIEELINNGKGPPALSTKPLRCRSCNRLLPDKSGVCPKCVARGAILRRLIRFLAPYRFIVISLGAVLLASIIAELAAPLAIRQILDRAFASGTGWRRLLWLVGFLLAARLGMWLCETRRGRLSAALGSRVTADVRQMLFEKVVRFPMRSLDAWSVGTLLSRFVNDIARLEEFLGSGAPLLVLSSTLFGGILVLLIYLSPTLTAAILLPTPFIGLWTWLAWKKLRRAQDRQSVSLERLSRRVNESLNGIRIVKAFCQEEREYARFQAHNEQVRQTSAQAERTSFLFFTVIYFLMNLGVFLVWYMGGRQVLQGGLTVGSLLAAVAYLWMLYWPLQWLGQVSNSLGQALTGAVQCFELVDSPIEESSSPEARPSRRLEGLIEFRHVTFGYEPGRPVLRDFSFRVQPGEVIGIIGRSGAGKTTLINLLCRFYEVERGSILIDGIDIRNYRLDELRKQVAIVPQDMFLFHGTIAENIRYGRPDATLEEVVDAARMAHAHPFILQKSDGYDTLVGPRGDRLSGGEKQRVAIARAILANPQMLILDEATSSLDVESERAIQRALARVARNRTTLIIAHRLSTIRSAHRLIVLDGGRLAESGSYDELLARKGLLWEFANAYAETKRFD